MKKGMYEEAWDRLWECFDEETEEGWEMRELMRQIWNDVIDYLVEMRQ